MSKEITLVSNALKTKILDTDVEVAKLATQILSYYVAGYENTPSYKAGRWDGKSTMYDWDSRTFPVGFTGLFCAALVKAGYTVKTVSKALPAPLGHVPKSLGGFSYSDRYDYQWNGLEELKKRGIMISRLATGAGKTFHAALAIAMINRPTLILTKRQPLMHQFRQRLKKFGFESGIAGDQQFSLDENLTVAMSQTLNNKIKEGDQETIDYLKTIEFIIGEEAHEVSDESYWNVIQNCPNSYYRLGLTGTAFLKAKSEANFKLLGAFGQVGLSVTEGMLIERGINSRPIFKYADYPQPTGIRYSSNYQKSVDLGIVNADTRNQCIIDHTVKAVKYKLPTLILILRKNHGFELERQLISKGVKAKFIWGQTKASEREKYLEQLSTGKIDVLIGSNILDVGVDCPAIGLVVLAGGGKAEVNFRQRIGRGLREKQDGPNVCFILDFADEHNEHLNSHYRERLKIIKSTEGFAENLLKSGEDFPWELFEC